MLLGKACDSERLDSQSFQAGGRTAQTLPKSTADLPGHRKVPGIFTYRGAQCLIIPIGKRFAVIFLSCGNPVPIEWNAGKLRKDFSSTYWAKRNTIWFLKYWIRNGKIRWNDKGQAYLLPRETALVPTASNTSAET